MKLTKLSLVATLVISSAFAEGDIEARPLPVVQFPQTTVTGKNALYYYSDDNSALFDNESSLLGAAVTLDVAHKFNANITANFTAIGITNLKGAAPLAAIGRFFEQEKSSAIFNVANITANYSDTTFILGRQLLETPMISGFAWLLDTGAFEAYTAVNSSIENVTLIGSYIRTWRPDNSGTNFIDLTDIDDGHNWTVSAGYDNKVISANVWYYNVDAGAAAVTGLDKYTQIYADGAYDFEVAKVFAQYVNTAYSLNTLEASNVFGAKGTTTIGSFDLMAAYVNVSDEQASWIGIMDSLYTSSWNTATGASLGNNFKAEVSTEFAKISASLSYAYYEYGQNEIAGIADDGQEIDLILGYDITDAIDAHVIYTNTDYGMGDDTNALELYANYKF